MSRRGRRRWVRRAVVALAFSAAVQVAVILAPRNWIARVIRRPPETWSTQYVLMPEGRVWLVDWFDSGILGEVLCAQTLAGDDVLPADSWGRQRAVPINESRAAGWSSFQDMFGAGPLPTDPAWQVWWFEERVEGWPWRCVRGEEHRVSVAVPSQRGALLGVVWRVGYIHVGENIQVPVLPIWAGIAFDLLAFALPCYLLLWAAGAARRRRRSRRGRCAECNYDLTGLGVGSVCPECGLQPNRIAPPKRG